MMKPAASLFLLAGLLALCVLMPSASGQAKPGRCPRPTGAGICVEACSSDSNCERNLKCCSNGCGHVCMPPVF